MASLRHFVLLSALLLLCNAALYAQTRPTKWTLGVRGGAALYLTDWNTTHFGGAGDLLLRYGDADGLSLGLMTGVEELKASQDPPLYLKDYKVKLDYLSVLSFPVSAVAMYSLSTGGVSPYVYLGVGALGYVRKINTERFPQDNGIQFSAIVPAGVGVEIPVGRKSALAVEFGARSIGDWVDARTGSSSNAFLTAKAGIHFYLGNTDDDDDDHDGLTNGEEQRLRTDPDNPDTDGDGVTDGDEVHTFHTNPLKPDTDGDGLTDGDEIYIHHTDPTRIDTDNDGLSDSEEVLKYHTDPLKADTDGDGLSDGDEVRKYHTDPLKADTDGDGLSDGEEVLKYHTDPLKADTDGDGLSDGDEVNRYKTNPLKADTDGGGVPDGVEIRRLTNPLDPKDDRSPAATPAIKLIRGKTTILERVVFEQDGVRLSAKSDSTLTQLLQALNEKADLKVEIAAYTYNLGSVLKNDVFTQRRADAIKVWLISHGADPSRLSSVGMGAREPLAPETTAAGKAKNRRIELHVR